MKEKRFLRVVEGAIKGNEKSFNELIRLRGRNILYIALNIMQDQHDGEDAAQEAIVQIRRDIAQLRNPESFDAWMYRIVYNTCMDAKKLMKKSLTYLEPEILDETVLEGRNDLLPEEYVQSGERLQDLTDAIKTLPERYRFCLFMYYYENMSYEEIADVMDSKVQDVANVLNRAKKKLRVSLLDAETLAQGSLAPSGKQSIAAGSAITLAFASDSKMAVTDKLYGDFLIKAIPGATTGMTPLSVAGGMLSGLFGKVAAAALCGVVLIGGGIALAQGIGSLAGPPVAQEAPSNPSAPIPQKSDEVPAQSVISSDQAKTLNLFAGQGTSKGQWDAFASENDLHYLGQTIDPDSQYLAYTLANAENNTHLVIIARVDNGGRVAIAYNTGYSNPYLPARTAIMQAFRAWR